MAAEQLRIFSPGCFAAVFRQAPMRGGVVAMMTRMPLPFSASSSPLSVATAMGSDWARTFTSGHTAVRVLRSSAAVALSSSKGYTRSHTSRASAGVTERSSPPSFRKAAWK